MGGPLHAQTSHPCPLSALLRSLWLPVPATRSVSHLAHVRCPALHIGVVLPTTLQMLLCASVLAQSGFARPRQQHRVPLTRCRVARAQVPNRLHPLRRRASSSRSRCIRTLQADRGRVQVTSGAKKWDCDSRPRRLIFPGPARTQGPSTRRATTTQGRHRPGARFKSTTPPLCPHSLTTRVSLSRRFLFRLATLRVSRGCEMGCAGDARQASVPAATSDSHTQERLSRHTRRAPHASRRRRWAGGPGPRVPRPPRTSECRP